MSDELLKKFRTIPFFAEISDATLEELAATATTRAYRKNVVIINEGDDAGPLFIVLSGKVQVYLTSDSGRIFTLSIQDAGSFFGELSLLDDAVRSASVMTLEPTICCMISRTAFRRWLENHPDAVLSIIRSLSQRIRILTDSVRGLALSDVYGRLAKILNSLAIEQNGEWVITERPSLQDLANRVGCSREMVSKAMKDLMGRGYLSADQNTIHIKRPLPVF
jgi:CRP/FNR family cyclic AMP-dependent transcriptional regulator